MKEKIAVTDESLVALLKIHNIRPIGYVVCRENENAERGSCLYESTAKTRLAIGFFSWLNMRFSLYELASSVNEINKEYPELW